ncbi:MAG: hypothetical protein JW748_15590 [Anaerolineales bacterium]|nr:hypothetical protein [Anaerolineales bacterium]
MKVRDALERFLEKHEPSLYAGLFLAALLLRLTALESAPLSGTEAAEAWGAMDLLRGGAAGSSSALYASLTAGVLFISGASHWAPRVLPAAAGALAVLLPLLLRPSCGRIESFLLALLLALSPALWIASTMAGGTALGFLAAGFVIFHMRSNNPQPLSGGLALGLAVASGPVGWSGLAIAAIVPLAERIFQSGSTQTNTEIADGRPPIERADTRPPIERTDSRSPLQMPAAIAGFILGAAAGSTGLFFFPRGIGALAAGLSGWLASFFSGWPRIGEFILLFLGYEPIALVFGIIGLILLSKGLFAAEDRFWAVFAAVAAAWVLLRPAAFPGESVWVILPLLVLGARALRLVLESSVLGERPVFVAAQGGAICALAAFAVFNLAAYVHTGSWLNLGLALAGFLGGIFPGLLFSEDLQIAARTSLTGLALAWFSILAVTQAGAGWNATHARRASANELWQTETTAADVLRLHGALVQISEWQTGVKDELAVAIQLPEESALGWELLTYKAAEYAAAVDMLAVPPMLIAPYVEVDGAVVAPRLTVVYRGQAFGYTERRAWYGWPPDLIRWLLFREGPAERERVILWVRSDILVPEEGAVE